MKRIIIIFALFFATISYGQVTSVKPVDLTGRGTTFHDLDSLMLVYNGTFNTGTLSNLWTSYLKAKADAIYATQTAVALKVNSGDTALMLLPYLRVATATAQLNLKVNIADTAAMLTNYEKSAHAASTFVPKTTTVNGHALSTNVTIAPTDIAQDVTHRWFADAFHALIDSAIFDINKLDSITLSFKRHRGDSIIVHFGGGGAASDSLYFDSTSIIGTGSATNPLRSNPEYKIFHALDSSWWKLYVDSSHALRLVQYYPGFNSTPNPPTSAVISDAANTFDFTYSTTTGFGTFSKYEYSIDAGLTYQPLTAKPLNVGDNAYAIGVVQIRAKAGPGTNASSSLTNPSAFTVTASNVNVLTNSEGFWTANPPFTAFNVTGTHAGDSDPVGGTAASFFQLSGTTGASVEYRGDTSVTGTTYTLSLYCQPASPLTTYNLWVGDGSFTKQCESNFDLSTTSGSATIVPGGAVSAPTSSVSPVAGHLGWYRVSLTWTAVSSYNAGYFYLGTANGTAGNTGHIFGLMKNTGSAAGTYQRKP